MPTAEQLAFWAAIRANPDDDTPRLVYADWLQENGDEPRAEFIRVQCALARLPSDRRKNRKERAALQAREDELVTQHKAAWSEWLVSALAENDSREARLQWLNRFTYARGFVDALYLNFVTAHRLIASGVVPEPIKYLEIGHRREDHSASDIATFASWKHGHVVSTLSVEGATHEDVIAFLVGGKLTNLHQLDFWSGTVGDTTARELAMSPLLATVTSMTLSANHIFDAGALALANSPHLVHIRILNLRSNPISPYVRRRLLERFGGCVHIEPAD
jgi:uncharacterized protein (TIGR02996 family)